MIPRNTWAGAALLSLLAAVTSGCKHEPQAEAAPPAAEAVPAGEVWITKDQLSQAQIDVEAVAEHDVHDTILVSGRVAFDDQRVGHVFSPLTGRVARIDAKLGQIVKKGDPLANIVSPDLGQASSDLSKADADLMAAEHDYKRKKDLFAGHAASAADLEASEDAYRKAKAERERAHEKVRLLRGGAGDVTQGYTLTAPIDGEVIARNVSPGAEVQGQYGSGNAVELFTVGQLDRVWVLADVFEMDLARVKVGSKVSLSVVAYPGRNFEGTVDWVSGTIDPTSRTAKVRCSLPNDDRALRPEMYATVRLEVGDEHAVSVPRASVLRLGDQLMVWEEKGATADGRVRFVRVPVKVSDVVGTDWLPLTDGPKPGARIVASGGIILLGMLGTT
ncbi:MAG TPA: efflux RND transporter periplasmic adaptor subunit [Polyangiaceae bacterium]